MMDRTRQALWETGKTVLLIGLVALSVILTWLSWSFRPPFMAAEKSYTSIPSLGEEKQPEDIFVPEWMVFHTEGEHRLAYPFSRIHRQTLENVYQWRLVAMEAVPWQDVDWLVLRRGTGIEFNFGTSVPLGDLPWFAAADSPAPPSGAAANRLWLADSTSFDEEGERADGSESMMGGTASMTDGIVLYLLDDQQRIAYRAEVEPDMSAWESILRTAQTLPKAAFYPSGDDSRAASPTNRALSAEDDDGVREPAPSESSAAKPGRGVFASSGSSELLLPGEVGITAQLPFRVSELGHSRDFYRGAPYVSSGVLAAENGFGRPSDEDAVLEGDDPAKDAAAWDEDERDAAHSGWYLPVEQPVMDEEVWLWEPIPLSFLYPYLFVDPNYIREIVTRDGVVVYTDGSRSLQVESSRLRGIYDAPAVLPPLGSEGDGVGSVKSAVQFINQYGGWIGNYVLDNVRQFTSGHVRLSFRYYHQSYPVYADVFGGEDARIEFSTQSAGQVTTLERPLYRLSSRVETHSRRLPGGEAVYRRLLELYSEGRSIRQIRLAYRLVINPSDRGHELRLLPDWVFIDGDQRLYWMQSSSSRQ